MFFFKGVILLVCFINFCYGADFTIPPVIFEAYQPSGFRASIPALPGVELFGFHGKVNKPLSQTEPGEFSNDVKDPVNGYFTYYNPTLTLTKGDVVHYWVFVQHKKLGYRKDAQTWTVNELRKSAEECSPSITKVSDRANVCSDKVVFEDNFEGSLDNEKWILEQYIPTEPDYEFVVYKKDKDVTFTENNKLCIKPKLVTDAEELKNKFLDINDGCTKEQNTPNCRVRLFIIHNPIVSGRLTSKLSFLYGKFEIRARLPSGDWLFPEIYLEDKAQYPRRILIAYSRGNLQLSGSNEDIGGKLLFGGPITNHTEPVRSQKLSSYRHNAPLSGDVHTYTLIWRPSKMELFIDDNNFGSIDIDSDFITNDADKFHLVLGVGAGGISDFPDNYKSGSNDKPWKNKNAKQVKDFYLNKDTWYQTWDESGRQLQVEYVKVTAI